MATSQLSGNALSRIVPAGAAAGAALQYRMLALAGIDTATAATGLTATSLIGTATLLALPLLAIPAALAGNPVPRGLAQSALGAFVFVLLVAVGALLLTTERPLAAFGRGLQWLRNRMKRHTPPRTDLPERLTHERDQIRETLGASWWRAVLFAAGNSLFDYLALLAALTAVGSKPRPTLVLLAYVAAMVLGMIPITPGGLGFVEAGLTATLTLAGVSASRRGARDARLPPGLVLAAAVVRALRLPDASPAIRPASHRCRPRAVRPSVAGGRRAARADPRRAHRPTAHAPA